MYTNDRRYSGNLYRSISRAFSRARPYGFIKFKLVFFCSSTCFRICFTFIRPFFVIHTPYYTRLPHILSSPRATQTHSYTLIIYVCNNYFVTGINIMLTRQLYRPVSYFVYAYVFSFPNDFRILIYLTTFVVVRLMPRPD